MDVRLDRRQRGNHDCRGLYRWLNSIFLIGAAPKSPMNSNNTECIWVIAMRPAIFNLPYGLWFVHKQKAQGTSDTTPKLDTENFVMQYLVAMQISLGGYITCLRLLGCCYTAVTFLQNIRFLSGFSEKGHKAPLFVWVFLLFFPQSLIFQLCG